MDKASTYQKRKIITFNIVIFLLLILWIPVGMDKVANFAIFKTGILQQPFSNRLGYFLIYTLPILEVLTVLALIFEKFRKLGLILSTFLMTVLRAI